MAAAGKIWLIECDNKPEIVGIFGKSGSGKSRLLAQLLHGRPRVILVDPLREYGSQEMFESANELLLHAAARKRFAAVYRFPAGVDAYRKFPRLLEIVYEVRNVALVVDEVSMCLDRKRLPKVWDEVVNQGRHRGLAIIAATQRFTKVNRDFTATATKLFIFRTDEPADHRYFRDKIGKAAAAALAQLPDHTPYEWSEGQKSP